MRKIDPDILTFFARKYIWWKSEEDALERPDRLIAQVMNIGDFDDAARLEMLAGQDAMRDVLRKAEIGQFTPRSWSYWHYRLDMAAVVDVPALPSRRLE